MDPRNLADVTDMPNFEGFDFFTNQPMTNVSSTGSGNGDLLLDSLLRNMSGESWNFDEDLENFIDSLRDNINGNTRLNATQFYTMLVLYVMVICVGVSGNTLVVCAVLWRQSMRTPHNLFIAALAVSDLLLCSISMPVTLWELLFERWPFGRDTKFLCRMVVSGQVVPLFMSSMAIVTIAWDRYRCVILRHRWANPQLTAYYISYYIYSSLNGNCALLPWGQSVYMKSNYCMFWNMLRNQTIILHRSNHWDFFPWRQRNEIQGRESISRDKNGGLILSWPLYNSFTRVSLESG